MKNTRVFLDISINKIPSGSLVFELYDDTVPKTTENFRCLCIGDKGLTYKNSSFHRIIPGFMCQGGDINGTGGISIYGDSFKDESFRNKAGKHTGFGCLTMANSGPNTNNSQFLITTDETPWLDGKHVVFGKLILGDDLLENMELSGSQSGTPTKSVTITDCGIY